MEKQWINLLHNVYRTHNIFVAGWLWRTRCRERASALFVSFSVSHSAAFCVRVSLNINKNSSGLTRCVSCFCSQQTQSQTVHHLSHKQYKPNNLFSSSIFIVSLGLPRTESIIRVPLFSHSRFDSSGRLTHSLTLTGAPHLAINFASHSLLLIANVY